jgi:hypothetical protein
MEINLGSPTGSPTTAPSNVATLRSNVTICEEPHPERLAHDDPVDQTDLLQVAVVSAKPKAHGIRNPAHPFMG